MQTETLAAMLASSLDPAVPSRTRRRYIMGITTGALVAIMLMKSALHLNPSLSHEAVLRAFWVREAFCAALGVLWTLAVAVLWSAAPQNRMHLLLGGTARVCPFLIAFTSAPLFAAFIWILKDLAPTRLRWAGATAGLAAGSIGALVYSLHCPELAPPFIGTWYLLGMLIPTGIGALLAPRLLRW